jgi:hypothetical protein
MNEPYYELTEEAKKMVIELIKKCEELGLGNISFQFYCSEEVPQDIFFDISKLKDFWKLVVSTENKRDIYQIINKCDIKYDYSEKD